MQEQIKINPKTFERMEKNVVDISKSLIESFKFKMILGTKEKFSDTNKRAVKGLKEFRDKNWDKKLSTKEAYKKYISLYN